ncbi:transporter substrate-binding domain-containing protein [Ignatzschineria cameli]|uniref:Glutamate/aspartate ABC transporter substrate-binding protein n=1 Tax=Ignatzschineria cameli TaxID=2182793 RepID=A0ABX5L1B2_9GAMM|nr:transporter substrate-binding domain-containing protein [Ignatzschineria cameli]PWD89215.1 glutamate/aspartate ABC transporter substrate-binding protein [Ignatzschineria cameli]PWD90611.1 glutamate/aspartate ABC transporter substrate-binding protein [Ignatzschineria cameli]PWD91315.1 glutamate/aspartate ABC transporter substrate-binding protein [Ignatzschineria cameli]
MKKSILGLALCGLLALPTLSMAEELTGTLKKIDETGTITLGHRESSIPYSYYDNQQNVVGYSHEISMKIVEGIEKKLGKKIDVKLVPITSQNRIPLMKNGTIDLECGSTTHNTARAQEVDFTNTIFIINIRMITDVNTGIESFEELKDKVVITTAGTTSERVLRNMNAEKGMNMRIQAAKDHGDAFMMLADNRGVAFVMDDSLLYGERAKSPQPDRWVVTGESQGQEAYACMLRKGDSEFKALADQVIADLSGSGEMEVIYNKWFTEPIPPRNANLEFPLSESMRELFNNQTDKPYQ